VSDAPVNVHDFEAIARARMEPSAYDYYAGGANDERTLLDNCAAFDRLVLRPRVLVGAGEVDTSVQLFDSRLSMPVMLAPTALNRLGHPDGELAAARAAGAAGTVMCCSTAGSCALEEIAAEATGPLWFQLYVYRDRAVTEDLVRRAEASRCRAIVLTVDTPRLGRRERDVRNQFALPADVRLRNLEVSGRFDAGGWSRQSSFTEYVHHLMDDSLTWESVAWLRSITRLPLLIKGVLTAEDAGLALEHGAAGVIVSNHGGRQLDRVAATIDVLPEVVAAVGGRGEVYLDGGVRRGVDVLVALALGARAVFVGRPHCFALAVGGEAGVTQMLGILRDELVNAMQLLGAPRTADVVRAHVAPGLLAPPAVR